MFLAVYRNILVTCAKGQVLSFAKSCIAARQTRAAPSSCVWTNALTSWGHQMSQKCFWDEKIKFLQRVKVTLSSLGEWPSLRHFPADKLHGHVPTFRTAFPEPWGGRPMPAFSLGAQLTNQGSCQIQKRTHPYCPAVNSSGISRLSPKPLVHRIKSVSHFSITGSSFVLQGYRGYSNSAKPKPQGDEDSLQSNTSKERDSTKPSKEGLSNFKELYENPWTIPNFLCMARIALAPVLGYLIVEQCFHLSLGLFVLAGVTDLLDGYIARNWANQKSALGSALDPLADKILISVLYISLTYASLIPAPLTVLVISRDVALIAAVFYVRYKTVPPPRTLSKFFNPCYATAQLKPTFISKVNTAIQLVLVAASLAAPVFQYTDSVFLQTLWLITALTTAASGYSYYHYGKKTVEVLNKSK
ncbi:cardiolipin synthase (CMP-forming) [Brienomyrus brachyistius]|uniref:cardiolipin synthase (CMP-forming) n=1 Tax=Brienomyrus brachyistius TaxID=42636 RepID=UPI0020B17C7F|nr:cardiolipin synthase (CMP-forming) [Brienomyrus brachyistius]